MPPPQNATPAEPPDAEQKMLAQKLKALRKSPGSRLIAHSPLFLQTVQMDMDYPQPLRTYVREQMSRLLRQKTGQSLSPDNLHITFITEDNPAVENNGNEHFSLRLSLTELGMTRFAAHDFIALTRCPLADEALSPPIPGLTASALITLLYRTSWDRDYSELFVRFWQQHEGTYRALAKLTFLDQLARHYSRKKISHEGYQLALYSLGLDRYPDSPECLLDIARGQQAELHMLNLNGSLIPGIFQLRSKNTSHCFIHILGARHVVEYISDDPHHMSKRLLDALKNARSLIHLPDISPPHHHASAQGATLVEGDIFEALTHAQKNLGVIEDPHEALGQPINIELLKPIKRGLALASAVDLWHVQPDILKQIPVATRSAAHVMHTALHTQHGLELNPDHVFIRYLPGSSRTPLGNARQSTNFVHVPDETPISLSVALINNYRVERPVGYLDHGARTVVYLDPSGKGEWAQERALPISPEALEATIKGIDFLALMSAQIKQFWNQKDSIERAFQSHLVAQAVIGLKCGNLTRGGFDRVVEAMVGLANPPTRSRLQWRALGFNVYSDFLDGVEEQYCAGLLLLAEQGKPERILYQAGRPKAFIEFADHDHLVRHVRTHAADAQWRKSVLGYIPGRHQERLDYLLRIWAGQAQAEAVSLLRPWTDINHNPDVHDAQAHVLREKILSGSPFAYMRKTLQDNDLENAQTHIVTSGEVSLRYWTQQLSHLHLLLAPMAILLTPSALAAMAIEVGLVSLDIASANLPGHRSKEKLQAILAGLSLGLLDLAPATPRLLRSLKHLATTRKVVMRAGPAFNVGSRGFGQVFEHSVQARRTQLEPFFRSNRLLKTWKIPGNPQSGRLPVKVWKLGRRFLLWTSDRTQASTLLVSTHGYYLPWSGTTRIPAHMDIYTYAPHGYGLTDPGLSQIAHRRVRPFAVSNSSGNTPFVSPDQLPPLVMADHLMAGTPRPGRLKNYTLSKYQNDVDETYEDISNVVSQTNRSPLAGQLPAAPMDVLTVRNRFGMPSPDLEDLLNSLAEQGIHYDRILLVHCRCSAIDMLLDRVPPFTAPMTPLKYP